MKEYKWPFSSTCVGNFSHPRFKLILLENFLISLTWPFCIFAFISKLSHSFSVRKEERWFRTSAKFWNFFKPSSTKHRTDDRSFCDTAATKFCRRFAQILNRHFLPTTRKRWASSSDLSSIATDRQWRTFRS